MASSSPVAAMQRARAWLFDIFAHNHAEQLRINREVQRQKLGLPSTDQPYPGSQAAAGSYNVTYGGRGWLVGPVLGAFLVAGGAAATALLAGRNSGGPSPTAPAAEVPPVRAPQSQPREFDYVKYRTDPNGKEQEVSRTRCRQMPDGSIQRRAADGNWANTTWEELETGK